MTVLELIKSSLRVIRAIGSSETPTAGEFSDALNCLNSILGEWDNMGLVSMVDRQTFNIVSGTQSYTIGPAQTWSGNKPLKILSAHVTLDSIDYPLAIIGDSEYMDIQDKSAIEQPSLLYYLSATTTGTVYLVGKPDQAYTITLLSQKAFTEYTSVDEEVALPKGYLSALKYALAVEIAPEYEQDPSAWIIKRAQDTLSLIKKTNLKKPKPMELEDPFSNNRGTYNILTDTFL